METVKTEQCNVCVINIDLMDSSEIYSHLKELTGWEVVENNAVKRLRKRYKFSGFSTGLDFVNLVGTLAEEKGHHPKITFSWGYVIIEWWSVKAKGIHESDFIMAKQTDELISK